MLNSQFILLDSKNKIYRLFCNIKADIILGLFEQIRIKYASYYHPRLRMFLLEKKIFLKF